jgi:transposase-like protein
MQDDFFGSKLGGDGGEVEVDETFIGGKARNIHKDKRIKMKVREENWGKTIVMGMLERGGRVQAKVVRNRKKEALREAIDSVIEKGFILYTDEHVAYKALEPVHASSYQSS